MKDHKYTNHEIIMSHKKYIVNGKLKSFKRETPFQSKRHLLIVKRFLKNEKIGVR